MFQGVVCCSCSGLIPGSSSCCCTFRVTSHLQVPLAAAPLGLSVCVVCTVIFPLHLHPCTDLLLLQVPFSTQLFVCLFVVGSASFLHVHLLKPQLFPAVLFVLFSDYFLGSYLPVLISFILNVQTCVAFVQPSCVCVLFYCASV